MAEETTIPLEDGSASSSVEVGLESPAEEQPQAPSAGNPDVTELQARIADMTRLNEQYLRERRGWESQSRRNMEEAQALKERLARIEGQLTVPGREPQGPSQPAYSPGQLKRALKSWLDGQETDLDMVEQALAQATVQATTRADAPDQETYKRLIREELMELGQRSTVQTIVGQNHPDMQDPRSPLSQAVWESYDGFAAAPATQFLYTKDARFEVPMVGPDGSQRMVDARIVDRLAADIRLKSGVQEGRRMESRAAQVGGVQATGSGSKPAKRAVEAIELLRAGELALLADPRVRKGWPNMPADPKAAAKHFFDGLPAEEKSRRIAEYQGRRGPSA
jgi:hypothetical protein